MNKNLRKVLVVTHLLPLLKMLRRSINFKKQVRIGSSRLQGVSIYGSSVSVSEPWMRQLLQAIMPLKSGVFCDVGVNLGQTLLCVKSVDKFREYIGFEPNPNCNMVLQELVRYNKWGDVRIVPVGLFTN